MAIFLRTVAGSLRLGNFDTDWITIHHHNTCGATNCRLLLLRTPKNLTQFPTVLFCWTNLWLDVLCCPLGSFIEFTARWGTLQYWKATVWYSGSKWSCSDTFWILQRELELYSWPDMCVRVLPFNLLNIDDGSISLWQWSIRTQKILVGFFVILLTLHYNILHFANSSTLVCDEIWQGTSSTWHSSKPRTTVSSWRISRFPVLWNNLLLLKQQFCGNSVLVGYITPPSLALIAKTVPILKCVFLHICSFDRVLFGLSLPALRPRCSHWIRLCYYFLLAGLWYMWPCRNERHWGLKSEKVVWIHFKPMAPQLNLHKT